MDPSIMKLLEEDEDETMHSGADLDAFTAALNRDIEGDTSASQPSDSESAALSQGNNHTSSQLFQQWQNSSQEGNGNSQVHDSMDSSQRQQMLSSEMDVKPQVSGMDYQLQHVDSSQGGNVMSSQQKQQQDDRKQRQMEENTRHYSQTLGLQNSEQNPGNIQEPDRTQNSQGESQYHNMQNMSNQRAMAPERAMSQMSRSGTQVPFALLLPVIIPQLDKDRAMQLNTLYQRLKKNEVSKDEFVRHMRSIVGDHMLKMAVYKLQMQTGGRPNQLMSKPQSSSPQPTHLKGPPAGSHQGVPQSLAQLHQKAHQNADSSNAMTESSGQKFREVGRNSDSHGVPASLATSSSLSAMNQERMPISTQGISKQQQQHLHFSQPSFPMYGSSGGNYHPFSGSASTTSMKQPLHDVQMRQGPIHQGLTQAQMVASAQAMNAAKFDRPNSFAEQKRVQGGTIPHVSNSPTLPQNTVHWPSSITREQKNSTPSLSAYVKPEPVDQDSEQQLKSQLPSAKDLPSFSPFPFEHGKEDGTETHASRTGFSASSGSNSAPSSITAKLEAMNTRVPSTTSAVTTGNNSKTPPKKPSVGQKKPLEALGSSPPVPSKKQKVAGAFSDQSIEQLNDVTAVSGVNLREEEEQLLSGPKEDSRLSEASRRVVQEEEERLLLQKSPLQKKLAEIMSKCGLKSVSNDVERCLSLCVEERMRGLVSNLIRLSKQRVDIEKQRHRTLITSDVRQQIMAINRKAREELEKKQAEAEKLQKLNDPEGDGGAADGDKDKDDGRAKSLKANKEEDDKMRTTAANVAARAAVGGDDMLSKWQLMAEQARQKREGGSEVPSGSQPSKDANQKSSSTSSKNGIDNQEGERRGTSNVTVTSGSGKISARNQILAAQARSRPTISVKDVIAVLEREPQMSKTTLIYRLYEKVRSDTES